MRTRRGFLLLLMIALLALLAVPPVAEAGHCNRLPIVLDQLCGHRPGPDPCTRGEPQGEGEGGGTQPGKDPMCLYGPASCVAVAVAVDVAPIGPLPGVNVQLSRSVASTFADAATFTDQFGYAFASGYASAHGDAHQARLNASPVATGGAIESECDAFSYAYSQSYPDLPPTFVQADHASGRADVAQFFVDLNPYGIPLTLAGDVLCEHGSSTDAVADPPPGTTCTSGGDTGPTAAGMGNRADIANLLINGTNVIPAGLRSVAPNTWVPLGAIGDLYLNEQAVSFVFGCPTFWGDALRLVVAGGLATVTIGHVATTTC